MNRRDPYREELQPQAGEVDSCSDVEHLLESMSLKKPSHKLDKKVMLLGQSPASSSAVRWPMLVAVGLSCLLAGILVGRFVFPAASPGTTMAKAESSVSADTDAALATANTPELSGESTVAPETAVADNLPDEPTLSDETQSQVKLVDEGLFLLDGKIPVRRFASITEKTIRVVDEETGEVKEVVVPIRKSFLKREYGT